MASQLALSGSFSVANLEHIRGLLAAIPNPAMGEARAAQIARPQAASRDDIDMLARLLVAEAGGEGKKGMQLVANVVHNRMYKGKGLVTLGGQGQGSLKDIVTTGNQFTGYNNKLYKGAHKDTSWDAAKELARTQLENKLPDISKGRFFYRNDKKSDSKWFQRQIDKRKLVEDFKLGEHTVYKHALELGMPAYPREKPTGLL